MFTFMFQPDVIKDLTVSNITTSSVLLQWEEPSGNRSYFKVQWIGDKPKEDKTNNLFYNITGLTSGVKYTFIIAAVAGDSSTEGNPVVISNYTKPEVIRNLTTSDITTSSVSLHWEEPSGYRSYFKVQWIGDKPKEDKTHNTSYNVTGLTPGVNYTFIIKAVAGDSSTEGNPVVISNYTKPDLIKNLTVSNITKSSVLLKWEEPSGNRSSFKVQWIGDKPKEDKTHNTSYNVTGLTPGVNYTFIIKAVAGDSSAEGDPVVISNYTKPDVIKDLTVSNITTSSVLLQWEEPFGYRSYFKVKWIGNGPGEDKTHNTSYNVTGLTPGVNYTFIITAVAGDSSTEGNPVVISNYTKPDLIKDLTVSNITTSSVFLKWEEPSGNRSYFKVQWIGDKPKEDKTNNLFYNFTGLTSGVKYTFIITAVAVDSSTEGNPVVISNYTKPDVIKDLTVSNITTSSGLLQWEEPSGYRSYFKVKWIGNGTGEDKTHNTSYNVTGLTPGVNYTFIIKAVAGDDLTEGDPVVISNYTKPDVIKDLTASNITTSSVLLQWEEPSGSRSYFKVQWIGDKPETRVTNNTFYNITGLTPGVNYTFIITAVAEDNSTEGYPVVISNYTKPDLIKDLTVSNITTSSVLLQWEEPSGNRSYFKVQWIGDKPKEDKTNNLFYNITGLTSGVKYTFIIAAVAGDSSTEGNPVVISNYTKPDLIKDLTVSNITTSSVLLQWEEPSGNRSFFKVQWIGDKPNEDKTNNLFYNITGLTSGVNYTFIITAVAGDSSTEGYPVVISNYTKPDVIKNLTVSNITTSSVLLEWEEPSGNRSYFKVQWISDKPNEDKTNNLFYNITGLTSGVNYMFIITAVAGDSSTEGYPVVISNYTKPDVINNLTVSNITTSSVLLKWKEPSGNRSYFKVKWIGDKTEKNITTDNTSYNITELTPGVNYTFIITAVAECNLTEGDPVVISIYTKPDVIKDLTVSNITTSSVLLKWKEPSGNRSYFKVKWIGDKPKEDKTNNLFYNFTGLTSGVNYTFIITAVAVDSSTEGYPVVISNYTKPDVINNLTVSEITTSSVLLKWKEPLGNRSYFKVQWIGDKTGEDETHNLFYNITGLTSGVKYTFIITAVAGDSSTEGNPVVISNYTKPDLIKDLTVSNITTSSVFLKWEEPSGNRSYFKVQWIGDKPKEDKTHNTSYNVTGLTPGVNYTFIIKAVAGDSSTEGYPVVISNYTKPDVIKDLTVSNITTSSVFLQWEEPSGNRSYFKVQWIGDKPKEDKTNNLFYNITGLTSGVKYTFIIIAVAGDSSTEGYPVVISNYTKPDVIKDLTVSNITTSSGLLQWEEPSGNRSYFKVQWTGDKINTSITYNTSYNITGLTPGVNYTFIITAVAGDSSTEGDPVVISIYTKPDVIKDLTVSNITTSSVFLKWKEPSGNRSYFKVQWIGDKTEKNITTDNTSYNITGLTPGVNYMFSIKAVAVDSSTEGYPVVISNYTKPDVIKDLTVSNITTSSVFLKWEEPSGNRSYFKVQWIGDKPKEDKTNNLFYNFTGLTSGVNYTFIITAVAGDSSTEGNPVVISNYTKPDVIKDLTVSNITTSSVFLKWEEPSGNRSYFKVQWIGDKPNEDKTNNLFYNVTGLTPGVNYTFIIKAVAGDSSTEGYPVVISNYTSRVEFLRDARPLLPSAPKKAAVKLQRDDLRITVLGKSAGSSSGRQRPDLRPVEVLPGIRLSSSDTDTDPLLPSGRVGAPVFDPEMAAMLARAAETVGVEWRAPPPPAPSRLDDWNLGAVASAQPSPPAPFFPEVHEELTRLWGTLFSSPNRPFQPSPLLMVVSLLRIWRFTVGRAMSTLVVQERHLWLCLADMRDVDKTQLLNAPVSQASLFGEAVENFAQQFSTAQKQTEALARIMSLRKKPTPAPSRSAPPPFLPGALLRSEEPVASSPPAKPVSTHKTTKRANSSSFSKSPEVCRSFGRAQNPTISSSFFANGCVEGPRTSTKEPLLNHPSAEPSLNIRKACGPDRVSPASLKHCASELTPVLTDVFNQSLELSRVPACFKTAVIIPVPKKPKISCLNDCRPVALTSVGCVLSPLLFSLYTNDCTSGDPSVKIIKYADDTKKIGLISNNDEFAYRSEVSRLESWCAVSNLELNINKTVEMIVDFSTHLPLVINNSSVSVVEHFKFLGTTITNTLKWDNNISQLVKKGQQRLFFLRRLKGLLLSTSIMVQFYRAFIESVLTSSLTVWFASASARTKARLQRVIRAAERIIGCPLPSIMDLHSSRSINRAVKIAADPSYPANSLFNLLPSGKRSTGKRANFALRKGSLFSCALNLRLIVIFCIFAARSRTALKIEAYEEYFKKQHADSNCGFAEEYEELKNVGTSQSKEIALAAENKPKNRYSNVLPYDTSRVKLSICGSASDDYINANYIPGYNSRKEFIAAQGPLPMTVNDFWRMIWEKNVYTVVMLTKCNEQGRVKCEKYWPSGTAHYHNISVTITAEITMDSWTIRDLSIKNVKTAETRNVRQFHFTAWPDHGVPKSTELLIDFRHLVREHIDQYSRHSPNVVHCSAGVGRTGTFIAIDRLIFQIERESMVDIYGIVNDMRMHRALMVQTEDQYVYLHQCAYDIIRSRTGTNVDLIYQNTEALHTYMNYPIKNLK
ncbi:receptor-type tyrosine-protein phosphatase beta [Misgurnus anguillicaudatus]|uniref:receptor-type tyrosine-protein phosphatase beta n=1 Tax=Misgurnus anguillicaudatus TaxID=75329 RepID=UPI003CCF564A